MWWSRQFTISAHDVVSVTCGYISFCMWLTCVLLWYLHIAVAMTTTRKWRYANSLWISVNWQQFWLILFDHGSISLMDFGIQWSWFLIFLFVYLFTSTMNVQQLLAYWYGGALRIVAYYLLYCVELLQRQ